MAKLVILKSLMDSYYDNMIEKSTTHKYIRRVPKSSGKGYNYFYPEDFKKPFKALLSFFGLKEDKVDKAYENNNINQAYGVTKASFAQHVLEYLTNRKTWNAFFANKANRERYKTPEKPVKETETVKVTEKEIVGGKTKDKITVEEKETKEKNFKSTWNRSLMRKIYSMYNSVPEDKSENNPGIDTIKVGDSVSYNGEVGKVTKDFENGMMFVQFESGGMGKFFVKDLQKMNPTADEVTETATENAVEQNVNGTNEAIQEEVTETVKENPYLSVGAEIVKDYQSNLDNIRNSYDEKKKNYIFSNEVIPNLIRIALRTAVKTSDTIDEVPQKTELIVDAIKQNMPEEERKLFIDYDFNSLAQIEWEASGKGKVQPVEKPGYNKIERAAITILYQKYKKENPELRDYQIYEKIKENVPDLDKKGNLLKTMTVVKNLIFDKELVPDVVNYIQENEIKETTAEEHENRSQAMMGNDNAKKDFSDVEKKLIAIALMKEKDFDPTLSSFAYAEKIREKMPELAKIGYIGGDLIDEVSKINVTADDLEEIKNYVNNLKNNEETLPEGDIQEEQEHAAKIKDAVDYYVSGDGMWINKYLRNPEEFAKEGGSVSEEEKQIIADLDKETTSTPITEKKLYRAVDASAIFGNISDGDFDDLVAHVVYGNNEKLIANKAGVLINRAENKQITEPGFMSTTKDKEVADNWDGFTGSNKEVILELDIPDGMTGKDLAAYDVEGEEQKEVLLPRNTDYFIKKITQGENGKILVQAQVLGQHGNHIAMLGNQNARKYGLSEEDELEYNKEYNWYKDTYVDGTRRNNPYSNEEETIERMLKDEADSRFKTYGENDVAYLALKDLYIDETGKEYTPPAKEEVKPQTEKAMKKEEKKLEKARVDAGLPKPDMFERTSTIDDSTWDPKSKNYRFRDTGYIAGARKEQAALYITRSAKQGIRVDAKEIDWDGVEENPRQAEKLIVKSNIFGEVDWNGLREKGMSGSAAFLIDRIYASAGSKPSENNADARHNYVIALNGLRDRFEDCKTVEDVLNTLNEIQDEIRGEYVEVKNTPKYQELMSQIKANRSIAFDKKRELEELSEKSSKEYNLNYQKLVEKYIEKGKKEKKLHWNARMSRYNIPKEYEADFSREEREILSKANAPWKKAVEDFKAELKARGVPEESFYDTNIHGQKFEISWYDLYELMPEMREADRLGKELDEYVKGQKVVVAMKNPLLEAWKSLGSRFLDIKRSDSFAQHRYDAKKGKYDNWDWLEKEVKVKEKKQSKEKKLFNLLVADSIERKGGRDMDISSTADLKKAFNLREVQSGNWVLKDPESAEFHVRNAARAFADLADITGIPDDKISLNGRLAMAFGARGTGNAGGSTAMAHYEHVERVINLTKFKGGGCLGHEWFHAFDNLLTCAMNGDDRSSIFLTNRFSNLTPATKELVLEYLKYKDSDDWSADYQRRKLAKKLAAKNFDVKELDKPQTDLQLKVQNAFDNLVAAMTTGDTEIKYAVEYSKTDYNNMLYNFKEENLKQWRDYDKMYGRSRPKMQVAIADAGNLSDAVKIINERYGDVTDKKTLRQKSEWVRLAAAYYDRNPNGNENDGKQLLVDSGKRGSQFLSDAFDLDENGAKSKDYWSSTHEMAARAFSAYIEDTLKEQGRQNDYLAYKSDNRYYMEGRPYPEGEERKKINAAFKKLFEVIKENNAIEKAVAIVDAPNFIIKNGRFLIRK